MSAQGLSILWCLVCLYILYCSLASKAQADALHLERLRKAENKASLQQSARSLISVSTKNEVRLVQPMHIIRQSFHPRHGTMTETSRTSRDLPTLSESASQSSHSLRPKTEEPCMHTPASRKPQPQERVRHQEWQDLAVSL